MVERKYLNSNELMDLYMVLDYINSNEIGNSEKWNKVDVDLYKRVKLYIDEQSDYFDTEYIDNFINNNYIVYLLRKITKINNTTRIGTIIYIFFLLSSLFSSLLIFFFFSAI